MIKLNNYINMIFHTYFFWQPAKNHIVANKAFGILMNVLHLHPPVNPVLHGLYLEVMRYPLTHSPKTDTENQGDEWNFILHVIQYVHLDCCSIFRCIYMGVFAHGEGIERYCQCLIRVPLASQSSSPVTKFVFET